MATLAQKIKINTTLTLVTGLHIGGTNENIEIGGIDKSVIKNGFKKNQPYIPGSSLKGKMRCLLEQMKGANQVGGCAQINELFGSLKGNNAEGYISKLIVRDAYITKESLKELDECDNLDMPYTEIKSENSIDRVKGTAQNPRQIERIPGGVKFDAEFIINVWINDNLDKESIKKEREKSINLLEEGLHALENDYLGGNGSRGYGQIKFSPLTFQCADESTHWQMVDCQIEK